MMSPSRITSSASPVLHIRSLVVEPALFDRKARAVWTLWPDGHWRWLCCLSAPVATSRVAGDICSQRDGAPRQHGPLCADARRCGTRGRVRRLVSDPAPRRRHQVRRRARRAALQARGCLCRDLPRRHPRILHSRTRQRHRAVRGCRGQGRRGKRRGGKDRGRAPDAHDGFDRRRQDGDVHVRGCDGGALESRGRQGGQGGVPVRRPDQRAAGPGSRLCQMVRRGAHPGGRRDPRLPFRTAVPHQGRRRRQAQHPRLARPLHLLGVARGGQEGAAGRRAKVHNGERGDRRGGDEGVVVGADGWTEGHQGRE